MYKRNCKNIIAALLVPLWFRFVSILIISPYFPSLIAAVKVCSVHRGLLGGTPYQFLQSTPVRLC